ncbi:MAG: translation initiation factor IF-2 N-terminal domain-containing protein, partial [Desulfobacteraceae bacterium]
MAKVRVYELARELNMDSKELVEKLTGSGMSIKNYMSTLDEAAAIKAKDIVSGVVSEVIEERRIKPTVIRRRKKIKRVEAEIPAAKIEEEVRKEKAEALVPEPPQKEAELPEAPVEGAMAPKEMLEEKAAKDAVPGEGILKEEGPPSEKTEPGIPAEKKAVKAAQEAKVKPKRPKKRKIDQPAKIIKRPEEGPLREVLIERVGKKAPGPPVQRPIPSRPVDIAKEVQEIGKREAPAKKRKEKKKTQIEEPLDKGVIRRRKREIYEKADLYEGRPTRRKGRRADKRTTEVVKRGKQTESTVPKAL